MGKSIVRSASLEDYQKFLERKIPRIQALGFDPMVELNGKLFDWQQKLVRWALRLGRSALFCDTGLGKTGMSLEWARQVVEKTGGKVLILCPLAVAPQHVREGLKFGIQVKHVREPEQIEDASIVITNYDRLNKFDVSEFTGIVLDESSVLRDFSGKTTQDIIERFSATPYRLCCTATPAPNDYEELGNHSEFLGHATRLEMLSTYFVHDSSNTSEWRLKEHAKKTFWKWIATWAACVTLPSDIGGSDEGFILPPLHLKVIDVDIDQTQHAGEGELFRFPSMSSTDMHKEMRITCRVRCEKAAELVNSLNGQPIVIWCNTNYESDELVKRIDAVEVRGSDEADEKERKLNLFTFGQEKRLIVKPSIAGRGINWQFCNLHIFVGLSYSMEDLYQAIRRGYRFGQTRPFTAYIIQARSEGKVLQSVMRKLEAHEHMRKEMKHAAKEIEFGNQKPKLNMKTGAQKKSGRDWMIYHGDCVEVARLLPDASVGFSIYSPPFSSLYVYSDDIRDMGNNADDPQFIEQYSFLIKENLRLTLPGRLTAVHCADLPAQIWKDGYSGLRDFTSAVRKAHEDNGWIYHSRITIWKDPVVEMQRTKALGLLWKQLKKDSCKSRVGNPDYILVFRKAGDNAEPVEHSPKEYPVQQWQKDASPVWMDINQTHVLSRDGAREQQDERHICPLQIDVIRRCLRLWSNPGDVVYSPFAGIGSELYCAIEMGRNAVGSELKASYFNQAVKWLGKAERERDCDLFAARKRKSARRPKKALPRKK